MKDQAYWISKISWDKIGQIVLLSYAESKWTSKSSCRMLDIGTFKVDNEKLKVFSWASNQT